MNIFLTEAATQTGGRLIDAETYTLYPEEFGE